YPLLLFSIGGMMLLPAANDLLTMFVALEVLSLPLYLLCGIARRRRRLSQEASLKYFLLGAFSSAFFLYGTALLYGYAGSVGLPEISGTILGITGIERTNLNEGMDFLLLPGAAMVLIGMLFKIGAAPFHVWTPDVYQGAPTPITGFMASVTKVAAFGALLRLAYIGMPGLRWDWQPVLFVVAIVTMLVGSIVAVVQADVKRMLAYSSIAHAGFLLIGILAMDVTGVRSTLFYLLVYGVTTVGAFALVSLVRTRTDDGGLGGEATRLSQWAGLGRRSPWLAGTFSLLLLALAGIPLTSGFIGKFGVFASAVDHFTTGVTHGGVIVVVFGVLASVIAAFFYVRVIVLMYFSDPIGDTTVVAVPGPLTAFAITVVAGVTILLGVYPSLLMDLTERLSLFQPS
ncbi:MAG: NADH-quinone oxidoreductase subunit NuoN, partial [Actinomycetales bacterium]|nr:NADH-quinone oxidoreductase subunit NuoN [Actinomycetales bacterium]